MNTTAWAEIHLDALRHNADVVHRLAPHSKLMAMIKADAYGHGLLPVARALQSAADGVAVARLDEALTLRESGIGGKLLLLGTLLDEKQFRLCSELRLAVEIHTLEGARQLAGATLPHPVEVWLKLNSGMNRLGLAPAAFSEAHQLLTSSANVSDIVHMSHFSSAENTGSDATARQIRAMRDISTDLGEVAVSMANSAAIIAHPDSHAHWVRPGIMLYGDNPLGGGHAPDLRWAMQLKSRILAVHEVSDGGSVGYNATWRAKRPSLIAAVGIGYGDGYPRHLPSGTPTLIHGRQAPLCGRVSMDIISVDVTDLPGQVRIGDEVLLWGEQLAAADIAERAGTISYELFTGVAPRVPRVYIDQ